MTLAVAIKAADGVVVAADSRGTIGDPRGLTAVNDTQQKVSRFGRCALATAGAGELALSLLDEFAKRGLNDPQDTDDALAAFRVGAGVTDEWFRTIPVEKRPEVVFLLAGYPRASASALPAAYLLTSSTYFAPQLAGNYPMMIGVPQYAIYLSHRYYDPAMTADNAAALAAYLISETASQDPKVGGPIRMAKVTQSGYVELTVEDVNRLMVRNEGLNAHLKRFFLNGDNP